MKLDTDIQNQIIAQAKKYQIGKVILFGSRARGDHRETSDIDLAVTGGNVTGFRLAVDDEVRTLLMFDVVNFASALDNLKLCRNDYRENKKPVSGIV